MSVDLVHVGIVAASVAVGAAVRRRVPRPEAAAHGPGTSALLAAAAVAGGTLAAKAPFVLADPASWTRHDAWLTDGRTLLWGLAGGYVTVEGAKRALGVTARTGDGFAAPVAAAVAGGRLSCFWSGCCGGIPTDVPWAVAGPDGVPRHPTQLYESAFHALAAAALLGAGRRGWLRTALFQAYLLAYCGFRFVTEPWRGEPAVAGLTLYQWSALAIGAGCAAVLAARVRAGDGAPDAVSRAS
jgi:phosphatidylglycerol:prolipoprotein diacylglycerol transferase